MRELKIKGNSSVNRFARAANIRMYDGTVKNTDNYQSDSIHLNKVSVVTGIKRLTNDGTLAITIENGILADVSIFLTESQMDQIIKATTNIKNI